MPDDAAGVAYGQRTGWNVSVDNTPGTDDAVVADGDAGQYADLRPDPHVVADGDGAGIFQPAVPLPDVERMAGRIETAVGGDEHMVAEADLGLVQDDAIHVGIEVFADFDVVAVVAEEGLLYQEVFPRFPQQGFQQLRPPPGFRRRQLVVCVALVFAQLPFGYQLRVVVGVV